VLHAGPLRNQWHAEPLRTTRRAGRTISSTQVASVLRQARCALLSHPFVEPMKNSGSGDGIVKRIMHSCGCARECAIREAEGIANRARCADRNNEEVGG
jgi:hypothetical protein